MAKKKQVKKVASKKMQKSGGLVVTSYHRVLFVQSMLLAVIGAAAVYGIIKVAQFRDDVDNQYIQVLGASTEKPLPKVTPKLR